MLTINAPVFDIDGSLVIDNPSRSGLVGIGRRATRTSTLDGGASISDFGFTDADRTLEVEWQASKGESLSAARLLKLYNRVIVSFDSGCFLCCPSEMNADDRLTRITLLVERKLSA